MRCIFLAPVLLGSWLLSSAVLATPPDDDGFKNTLAVQQAMEQARHFLLEPNSKKAVEVLEDQLARINGNPSFLRLLREAYRAHIKDLWLAQQGPLARKYLERLCIIDPDAAKDPILCGKDKDSTPPTVPDGKLASTKLMNVRPATNQIKKEDPFDLANENKAQAPPPQPVTVAQRDQAKELVTNADNEFARRRFAEARSFYERAHQADPQTVEPSKDRWAYCMLNNVVEQLNQPNLSSQALGDLQKQVHSAVTLAPSLGTTGKWLLTEIDGRYRTQMTGTGPDNQPEPVIAVQHQGRSAAGWLVTETPHFVIFHNQSKEYVEKIAQVAERTRQAMFRKWFGKDGVEWQPKCELFLHATVGDYSRVTGAPGNSPGHAHFESDAGRIISRQMHMHCDQKGMIEKTLPHETTHVVLAGMFGAHAVPRWADEGIAVLTEPSERFEQYKRNLTTAPKELLFGVRELVQQSDYPQPRRIGVFYAQSVALVDYLTALKGPVVFTQFLADGLQDGYEPALRRHFGMGFAELEPRFSQHLFGEGRLAQGR